MIDARDAKNLADNYNNGPARIQLSSIIQSIIKTAEAGGYEFIYNGEVYEFTLSYLTSLNYTYTQAGTGSTTITTIVWA